MFVCVCVFVFLQLYLIVDNDSREHLYFIPLLSALNTKIAELILTEKPFVFILNYIMYARWKGIRH